MTSRTSTPASAGRSRRPRRRRRTVAALMRLLRMAAPIPTTGSNETGWSCDFLPGQQHEHVLEVGGPALALGGVAVEAQQRDRGTGAAGREARGLRLLLHLAQPCGRAVDLDRLAPRVLDHEIRRAPGGDRLAV